MIRFVYDFLPDLEYLETHVKCFVSYMFVYRERSLATAASTGAYKIYKRSPYKLIMDSLINL